MKRAILALHRWVGLAAGVLILAVCLSGAALVFRYEIDAALNPSLFRATPGDVGFDRVRETIAEHFPDRRFTFIRSPELYGVYVVPLAGRPPLTAYVDPGTGALLGARDPGRTLIGALSAFHETLMAGQRGLVVVGVIGVLLFLVALGGVYLWWPGVRKLAGTFRLRRGRNAFLFAFDAHRLAGILAAPLLLALAATGVLYIFDDALHPLVRGAMRSPAYPDPPAQVLEVEPQPGGPLPLDTLTAVAERTVPPAVTNIIRNPHPPTRAVEVRLFLPGDVRPAGSTRVWLDPSTGRVLWTVDPRELSAANVFLGTWLHGIHFGSWGGWPVKLLYTLAGLMPAVLAGTGVVMWWRRTPLRRARPGGRGSAAADEPRSGGTDR